MTNQQYDAVHTLAKERNIDMNACPTCRQRRTEEAPGVWMWKPSTYKLWGVTYDCNCERQDNLRRHYLLAGIPTDYWTLSSNDFFGDPNALSETQKYLGDWVDWKWHGVGVDFYSPTLGTGKTMLATLIAKDLIQRGEKVTFIPFRDAIRTYDLPYEAREQKVKRLRNTPVLILDEVTNAVSEAQRGFFATELEDLVRFRTGGNGITIVTTNLAPVDLDNSYPRVFSLLSAKQRRIEVKGTDARQSGNLDLIRMELILNGETRPIT